MAISIEDLGNNKVALLVSSLTSGVREENFEWMAIKVTFSGYGHTSDETEIFEDDNVVWEGTVDIPSFGNNRYPNTVYVECIYSYGIDGGSQHTTESKYGEVKYYDAPTISTAPRFSGGSYSGFNKLTNKKVWSCNLYPAEEANSWSPVRGYLIRLYKNWNGSDLGKDTIPMFNTDGDALSTENPSLSGDYYYDNTVLSFEEYCRVLSIDPVLHGFDVGDTVTVGLQAYAYDGAGNVLYSAIVTSGIEEIVKANILMVKREGLWKGGEVFIKVNGSWKETEEVYVKNNSLWKLSI